MKKQLTFNNLCAISLAVFIGFTTLVSIVVVPMYSFLDFPYFKFVQWYDLLVYIFVACITFFIIRFADTFDKILKKDL